MASRLTTKGGGGWRQLKYKRGALNSDTVVATQAFLGDSFSCSATGLWRQLYP